MRDPLIFSRYSPPAHVYEFNVDKLGQVVPKEGRKNMENVNVTNTELVQANDLLDRVEPLTDEELEALLANGEFTQDAEDVAPEVETVEPTHH